MGSDANWGVTCTIRMGSTVRRTADNRLMMRNCFRYGGDTGMSDGELAHAAPQPHRRAQGAVPAAGRAADRAHTWGGSVCLSRNSAPYWGELAPGVLASRLLQRRRRTQRAPFAGRAIAEYALGHDSDLVRDLATLPKRRQPRPRPLHRPGDVAAAEATSRCRLAQRCRMIDHVGDRRADRAMPFALQCQTTPAFVPS